MVCTASAAVSGMEMDANNGTRACIENTCRVHAVPSAHSMTSW